MSLRIAEIAPDFTAETTEGPISFHQWIGDSWCILFSHPKDFTPVCTTELGYMARLKPEFDRRGVKIIGLSVDPVGRHADWAKDIAETQGVAPNFPMIGDPSLAVSKLYDMLPASSGDTSDGRTAADNQTVRTVFVIGPDKRIKLILAYPMTTGRNFDEVLRVIDSLQLTAKHRLATPVNWKPGEDVIIAGSVSNEEAKTLYPQGWKQPKPYIRIVPQPVLTCAIRAAGRGRPRRPGGHPPNLTPCPGAPRGLGPPERRGPRCAAFPRNAARLPPCGASPKAALSPRKAAPMIRSALMTVMTNAAIKAGRGLKRDFGEVEQLQVSMKGPGDFVSLADKKSEKTLYEELSKARPGYGFVMEEGGQIEGTDKSHTWHIDPLDATTNFLHAIPIFAISIALERDGQIVAGVVYNPADDAMYVTEKGQGAFGGNRRLRVAGRTDLSQALIGCGVPHLGKAAQHPRFKAELSAVMARVVNVRRLGCASLDLAYVAAGRFDAFWERGLNSWDIAAGALLIREAGGFVTDADGDPDYLKTGSICGGNEAMHREMLALLKIAA